MRIIHPAEAAAATTLTQQPQEANIYKKTHVQWGTGPKDECHIPLVIPHDPRLTAAYALSVLSLLVAVSALAMAFACYTYIPRP